MVGELQVKGMLEVKTKEYVVARHINTELWYHGTYDTLERANGVARDLGNGLVIGMSKEGGNKCKEDK